MYISEYRPTFTTVQFGGEVWTDRRKRCLVFITSNDIIQQNKIILYCQYVQYEYTNEQGSVILYCQYVQYEYTNEQGKSGSGSVIYKIDES
jgi:hypothetical protein